MRSLKIERGEEQVVKVGDGRIFPVRRQADRDFSFLPPLLCMVDVVC